MSEGAGKLSEAELRAIFLRVGVQGMSIVDLSHKLLKDFNGLRGLFKASDKQLR